MENNIEWFLEKQVERTIKNLAKHNIEGIYVDRAEVIDKVKELVEEGSTIGCGDSITLEELGIFDFFRKGNYNFLDKYEIGIGSEGRREIYIKNFSADVFITGTNALTEKGEIINIDGNGSRVAPMIYGPKKVIILVGVNKLVKDYEEGIKRVRNYAAPVDAKRLNKNTPCAEHGICVDCSSNERICNSFVTITSQFDKERIKVIIVKDKLGY